MVCAFRTEARRVSLTRRKYGRAGRLLIFPGDLRVSSSDSRHRLVSLLNPLRDVESSADLLDRVRAGDSDALDVLLRRYVPALRRWARGRLPQWARDMAETEDLVQETVVRSFRNMRTFDFRHDGALRAYLRQAVMNRIRDECRRVARRPAAAELSEGVPSGDRSPLELAIGQQAVARYEAALNELGDDDRQAIVARVEMGFSFQELAVMMGKPSADAARVAVSRALVRLAEQMKRGS
jgi:RNA polymerase sigma factor (sigma-70 family)